MLLRETYRLNPGNPLGGGLGVSGRFENEPVSDNMPLMLGVESGGNANR